MVAHGGGEEWNRRVQEVVSQVSTGGPVETTFLMGPGAKRNPFQSAARRLEAAGVSRIVVVPLLVSSHSGHYEQIRYLAGRPEELAAWMRNLRVVAAQVQALSGFGDVRVDWCRTLPWRVGSRPGFPRPFVQPSTDQRL